MKMRAKLCTLRASSLQKCWDTPTKSVAAARQKAENVGAQVVSGSTTAAVAGRNDTGERCVARNERALPVHGAVSLRNSRLKGHRM